MKSLSLVLMAADACALATASASPSSTPISSDNFTEAKAIIANMQKIYENNTRALLTGNCVPSNVQIRKSWSALSPSERHSYLSALSCLNSKPTTLDLTLVPGARTRRDDFTYTHVNQTDVIHNSGLLLPWHRLFIWSYESALRTECNYTGTEPYWDMSEFASNQTLSPVFDDSVTSFGSKLAQKRGYSRVQACDRCGHVPVSPPV